MFSQGKLGSRLHLMQFFIVRFEATRHALLGVQRIAYRFLTNRGLTPPKHLIYTSVKVSAKI